MLRVVWFVSFCFCLKFTFSKDTLRLNQSIGDSEVLVSDAEKFKLGFFSPENSSYRYVGVMYNLPVLTVVWVANRDKPLNDSNGTLQISEDGNLVILDGQKGIVWSSNNRSRAVASARLFNTGNFVLQDEFSGNIIWDSFQHATDSFVERMRLSTDLNVKNSVTSWRSPGDPAPGSFSASFEPLQLPQIVVRNGSDPYWRSGPWNGRIFLGISEMSINLYQNSFYLENDNREAVYLTYTYSNTSALTYFVLNTTGFLQQKLWSDGGGNWEVTWSSIENECDIYGKCGPFGSCNAQATPICSCLPGFAPKHIDEWNAGNWSGGCIRRSPLQCDKNNKDSAGGSGKQDVFLELETVKLPDHITWFPTPSSKADCGNQCLNNCSCKAYSYDTGIGCMMWNESLIDVQKFPNGGAFLYIRLARSDLGNKKDWRAIIATTIILGFITISVVAYFLLRWCRGNKQKGQLLLSRIMGTGPGNSDDCVLMDNADVFKLEELPLFKFKVLSKATGDFSSAYKLGEGGFGPVYKGNLQNGQEIAVKRLARSSNQGPEEFKNEVEVISKLQHRNLVKLLGCCVESEEKMLVYEYMPNGSLDTYIFGSRKRDLLDWEKRMFIIEGICRGLLYLHRDSRLRIIHRDLKASNILLDKELNPKISDFGMARIFGGNEDQANTKRVVGTFGYMAPEYGVEGRFSEKSDVYSFGVLLLEIVSGRKNTSFYDDEEARSLIAYAWKLWNEEDITGLMEPLIYDPQLGPVIKRYVHVGLLCVQEMAQDRPNISTVLSMLSSEIAELPHPKLPAFIVLQRSSEIPEHSDKLISVNNVTITIVQAR